MVDYKGFQEDSAGLQQYLTLLESHHPNDSHWSIEERPAYWINAYNAFTVELILKHYPVNSIKAIVNGPNIPFVNSPWDIRFINIQGNEYDLNDIEHGIIRDRFNESRIHFAVNCASVSCPVLRAEAYKAEKPDEQLNEQARAFLSDTMRKKISKDRVVISKIFKWYSGDFKNNGSLIDYLDQYTETAIADNDEISDLDYNWKLNDIQALER